MSPRRTFQSCGNSSGLVRRSHAPRRVMRGSAPDVITGPGASVRIVRSFSRTKGRPFRPTRVCRNSAGPVEVARTSNASTPRSGAIARRSPTATGTSSRRRSAASATLRILALLSPMPVDDVRHGRQDVVDVTVRHGGVERKAHDLTPGGFRPRELPGTVAPCLLVVRMEVQRNEMDARPDVASTQLVDEGVAVDPQDGGP